MIDSVPWFVGGGAQHSPETARNLAFHATEASNGITDGTDFKVTPTPVASDHVRIATGGGVMISRYVGANQQSYTCRAGSITDIYVSPTGSGGGQVRYVIIRVQDPQYEGQPPADLGAGPYVYPVLVSSLTNLPYPYLELARIDQPANTSTITAGMITDIRKMARIKSTREIYVQYSNPTANLTAIVYQVWPNYTPTIEIPSWATHIKGFGRVHQPAVMANTTYGDLRLQIGGTLTAPRIQSGGAAFDFNSYGSNGDGMRVGTLSVVLGDRIPQDLAGTSQQLRMVGRKATGRLEDGYLHADGITQVEFDIQFERRPV